MINKFKKLYYKSNRWNIEHEAIYMFKRIGGYALYCLIESDYLAIKRAENNYLYSIAKDDTKGYIKLISLIIVKRVILIMMIRGVNSLIAFLLISIGKFLKI